MPAEVGHPQERGCGESNHEVPVHLRTDVDLLRPDEAATLLRTLIGPRVDAEPDAAARLAEYCGRLPLALRLAAELAAARPALSVAELSADLRDVQRRLDLLDAGGDPRAVRGVFGWSV